MDPTDFDQLARSWSHRVSRRGVLGVVVGATIAVLNEVAPGVAERRQRRAKRRQRRGPHAQAGKPLKCTPNKTCVQFCKTLFGAGTAAAGQCISAANKCQGACADCGPVCQSNPCPQVACGGACRSRASVEAECPVGTGFLTAPDGTMRCAAGDAPACACLGVYRDCGLGTACQQLTSDTVICCPSGTTLCSGACVDLQTDVNHCGACGSVCGTANTTAVSCSAGTCQLTCKEIVPGRAQFANCDGDPSTGCEADLFGGDPNNCGSCGAVCARCVANVCFD